MASTIFSILIVYWVLSYIIMVTFCFKKNHPNIRPIYIIVINVFIAPFTFLTSIGNILCSYETFFREFQEMYNYYKKEINKY